MVVEYLWTCDSILVNPVVLMSANDVEKISMNDIMDPTDHSSSPNPAEKTDSSDKKSSNTENIPLDYNKYLLNSVYECDYWVITKHLSTDIINQWTGKVPHWTQLNPYSGLEDESSSDTGGSQDLIKENSECSKDEGSESSSAAKQIRSLRPRKCTYVCERLRREHTKDVFYRDQCVDTPSTSPGNSTQKKPKVKLDGPSIDRQQARVYNL